MEDGRFPPELALGDDWVREMRTEAQRINEILNGLPKGKPDEYTLALLALYKPWVRYYRTILRGTLRPQ